MKHTPGPWRIKHNGSYGPFIESCDTSHPEYGRAAHDVGHCTHDIAHTFGSDKEPNAKLIAAAPDLLAAAKFTTDLIQGGDAFANIEPWAQEICSRLNAAIAKAEGGENA